MLTHLPLGDSGTRLQRHSLPRTSVSKNITSHQLGSSRPTPPMSATLNRATNTNDAGSPRTQVHITLIPDHQHTCKVQESTPDNQHGPSHTIQTIMKRRAQHGLSPQHRPFTTVEQCVQEQFTQKTDSIMRYTKLRKMFATTCDVHKPP